jgi:hypothetical protein
MRRFCLLTAQHSLEKVPLSGSYNNGTLNDKDSFGVARAATKFYAKIVAILALTHSFSSPGDFFRYRLLFFFSEGSQSSLYALFSF